MIDLADLRGYAYHSGVMFSAYVDGVPNAVARGGRYDDVGLAYGRARASDGLFARSARSGAHLAGRCARQRDSRAVEARRRRCARRSPHCAMPAKW